MYVGFILILGHSYALGIEVAGVYAGTDSADDDLFPAFQRRTECDFCIHSIILCI